MIGLVISLMFFVLFLGLFAFDANRAQMCQRELIAACDASSIAGTAMLTSYDTSPGSSITLSTAQQNAGAYARNMFQKQVVLGHSLAAANLTTTSSALYTVSGPNVCNVLVALGDPANNFNSVNLGDPLGRTVMVFCCFGYQPAFLSSMPFFTNFVPLNASSYAGLPQVDAVVVFDYSGSMDDFTSVLFVRREWYWPGTVTDNIAHDVGCPLYSVVTGGNPGADNRLSNYINWNWSANTAGSATNVLPPQLLEGVSSSTALAGAIRNPLFFNPTLRCNPCFYPFYLGTSEVPVNNSTIITLPLNPTLLGTAAHNHPIPFGNYYSPNGRVLNGTFQPTDYNQPPGNYKPIFVAGDGLSSLSPTTFCLQYALASGSSMSPTWISWVQQFGFPPQPGYCNQYLVNGGVNAAYHLTSTFNGISTVDNVNFTDLVVNLVNPVNGGSYKQQPIPATTDPVLTTWAFNSISVAFPTDEQNTNLAGQTYTFSNLGTLVEASRGNLDSSALRQGACADGNVIVNPSNAGTALAASPATTTIDVAKANYQLAYERLAMLESQPYATAVDGAVNAFYYKMSTLCDARFGLVGFSGISQGSGNDGFGLSQDGGPAAYTAAAANVNSMGTAPCNSCLHSEFQAYIQANPGTFSTYFSNTTGQCREQGSVVAPVYTTAINGYVNGSAQAVGGTPAQQGYKIPRTALTASSSAVATDARLDMVSSAASPGNAPVNNSQITSSQSPYPAGAPYGDIWSSPSNDGIANGCWNGRPLQNTYCDEALATAFNSFFASKNAGYVNSTRRAARKAIVFFTDGEPTGGVTATAGNVASNSNDVANQCTNNSTSMYTIGLNASGNTILSNDQYFFLGDGLSTINTNDFGLAYKAGNGSRFFPCGTGTDVRNAFASVARRLSQAQN